VSSFTLLASDVSQLPKAPDLEFSIIEGGGRMVAYSGDWEISATRVAEGLAKVLLILRGQTYCRCAYECTEHPQFEGEEETAQVAGFAAGLFWSAWRRQQFDRLTEDTEAT